MNRLQFVEKHMTSRMIDINPKKYWQAQRLHAKIIQKQDEKIRRFYANNKKSI